MERKSAKLKTQKEFKLLKKELAKVKKERDIIIKCSQYLSAPKKARFEFIKQNVSCFRVKDMCRVLCVSKSGYYKWLVRTPSKRDQHNQILLKEITKIHFQNNKRYGSPRIARELKAIGINASEKLIRKLMKSASLESVFKRKFRITTNSSHKYPIVENKLQRSFQAHRENEVWVSDITYVWAGKRWLYFTVIIDLYDRKVVGWSLSTTLKTRYTTVEAFKKAITNRPIRENSSLIFHSDRGIQYACKEFVEELRQYKSVSRSMSRKGDCWDNAVSESFFKTIKTELVYQNSYQNKHQAEISIAYYIENFYNVKRRHSFLDNRNIFENNQLLKHA